MNDAFKEHTVRGLKCIAGQNTSEKMREYVRNKRNVCDDCVIGFNKKKNETCCRLVCEYTLDYLREIKTDNDELVNALECIACKKHDYPAKHYSSYRETECAKCKYGPYEYGKNCTQSVAADALKIIDGKEVGT